MKFKSELEFVSRIRDLARKRPKGLVCGIGDDAAIIESAPHSCWCLTSDLLIEGVHFDLRWDSAQSVGHKALAAGLSDIASMGARPRFALTSIAVPAGRAPVFMTSFYRGFLNLAARHEVVLIGGDTSRANETIFIDVVVVGCIKPGRQILRSGARVGDHVFVSGRVGKAALGLHLLRSKRGSRSRAQKHAVASHQYPVPRTKIGMWLADSRLATSMIDVSDGLSTDLLHLCDESAVGARIFESSLPLADRGPSKRMLHFALSGGEDYELLFTVRHRQVPKIKGRIEGVPVHEIGRIVPEEEGVSLIRVDGRTQWLSSSGWDHFH